MMKVIIKKKVVNITVALLILLELLMPIKSMAINEELVEIKFKDIDLYNKIVDSLQSKISEQDNSNLTIKMTNENILSVSTLNVGGKEIDDLSGIEHFTNVSHIIMNRTNVKSLEPLRNLTNLNDLTIFTGVSQSNISDIEPLSNLQKLEHLNISGFNMSNIEPLKNLSSLKHLDLSDNKISNIEPLKNLTNLEWLDLGRNKITNIECLQNLTNLTELELNYNQLADIEPITKLTKLQMLDLTGCQISNIEPLCNLKHEKNVKLILKLIGNNISDVSPIDKNLEALGDISISMNEQHLISESKEKIIDLPLIFIQAKDKNSIAYTEKDFKFTNCKLNEDGTKIIVDDMSKYCSIEIEEGRLAKSCFSREGIIDLPSGKLPEGNGSSNTNSNENNNGSENVFETTNDGGSGNTGSTVSTNNSTNNSSNSNDDTQATTKLPQTGVGVGVVATIIALAGIGAFSYFKCRRLRDI